MTNMVAAWILCVLYYKVYLNFIRKKYVKIDVKIMF